MSLIMFLQLTCSVLVCCCIATQSEQLNGPDELRVDAVKNKILQELNLKSRPPPNPMSFKHLPKPILTQYQNAVREVDKLNSYIPRSDETFLLAHQIDCPSPHNHRVNSTCFCFHSNTSAVSGYDIAQVWLPKPAIRKNKNWNVTVAELVSNRPEIVGTMKHSTKEFHDWVHLPMKHAHVSEDKCFIATCEGCAFTNTHKNPFLELSTSRQQRRPQLRSSSLCDSESNWCCAHSWYVNFTEIGWSDWIVHPVGYEANYCVGTCPPADLRYKLVSDAMALGVSPQPKEPCCAPKHRSPLSVIYMPSGDDMEIVQIQGMIVDECECP